MITMGIEIQKNEYRGWSCTSIVKYPDWENEVYTHTGYGTLKSSLWHAVLHCVDLGAELTSVTVNGEPRSFTSIWEIIHKALAGGVLSYRLGDIRELLGVET